MKIAPLIVVQDVEKASSFYQAVLGLRSGHGGKEYEMLMYQDKLVLQLHKPDVHEHPAMWQANMSNGNGVILWFSCDNFEQTLINIRQSAAVIVADPHINPNANQHEIWFKDQDGYLIVVSQPVVKSA
ncbi:Uncharacterised protein [Zhongshania aliphaticivorans]|uniref:VOC domain-containing protein n=1 Tax=Zhongshania aliphaticivorans TaxID=1470434 RepID=A0A5S9PJ46_9GAMM|nr:VOC family protein [Zhongshania aliphaticivorans]CAA0104070.1 Uncharacterised protein [Zhongshania aliphaticivorans]CAA0104252.1 Uncharacterised protein [Zhongshania aliphaticivorans]